MRSLILEIGTLMHASLTTSMIILGQPIKGTESVIYNVRFATVLWLTAAAVLGAYHMRSVRRLALHSG